jgi:hypothetical protein
MAIEIKTYGDLKKLVSAIKNKQTKDKVLSKGKEIAVNQILGFIPGASNVVDIAGLVKSAFEKPDTQKTDTWLDKLDIDDQVSAIVDDTVENGYLQSLVKNIQTKNDDEELPDDFDTTKDLQIYLKDKYRGRSVTSQMNENKKIIQYLLEQDKEDTPKTFEEDPMEFILKKYVSLNGILTELMTSSFRDYVQAIFIVAPKPTTFKIVLNNGQHIFLTYMGPAYEATVSGKNYYLMNIGEKERCMLAISKLLRGGNPINNKGPEGAEQAADAANEGGGEEGGSSLSATGSGEEGGGESPAEGGDESLTESKKNRTKLLLKLLIEQDLKKNKTTSITSVLQDGLKSIGQKSDLSNKGKGKHFRVNLGDTSIAIKEIEKILKSYDNSNYYKIDTIEKNDFPAGSKSGKYDTIKVTVIKPVKDLNAQDEAFIVNTWTQKSTITIKSLTPGNLGLAGKTFKNNKKLVSSINESLSKLQDQDLANFLIALTNEVDSKTTAKYKDVKDIKETEESISIDDKTKQLASQYSPTDVNAIGKDFGEVLGTVFLLNIVSQKGSGIFFPSQANNPLADFVLDGYDISSKYEKGAASTLTGIIKQTNVEKLDKKQLELFNILKIIPENKTSESYLMVAKQIKAPAVTTLSEIVGVDPQNITVADIQKKIEDEIKNKKATTSDQKSEVVMSTFADFYQQIGRYPKNKKIDFDKIVQGKEYGAIIGPLSFYVADQLNTVTKENNYPEVLTQLMSKIEVKQLYLSFDISKNKINFKVKSFTSPNAKFVFKIGNQSVYTPDQNKLAFQLV